MDTIHLIYLTRLDIDKYIYGHSLGDTLSTSSFLRIKRPMDAKWMYRLTGMLSMSLPDPRSNDFSNPRNSGS